MSDTNNKAESNEKKDPHVCGCETQVWSRVTGYYRPVANWNVGKKEEFKDRKRFNMDLARNYVNSK